MRVKSELKPLHPASGILSLGLLTILLGKSGWMTLLVCIIPLLFLLHIHRLHATAVWQMLRRIRWFILSIIILYFWFFPGSPLLPGLGWLSPSRQGIVDGSLRIATLMVVITYSVFLLRLSSRDAIIAGLQSLLGPLRWLGLDPTKISVRLGLVLAYVPALEEHSRQISVADGKQSLSRRLDQAAELFLYTAHVPDSDEPSVAGIQGPEFICIPDLFAPSVLDIMIPATLAVAIAITVL